MLVLENECPKCQGTLIVNGSTLYCKDCKFSELIPSGKAQSIQERSTLYGDYSNYPYTRSGEYILKAIKRGVVYTEDELFNISNMVKSHRGFLDYQDQDDEEILNFLIKEGFIRGVFEDG